MRHFGVKSWEEVFALFEKGGLLEGQWGWLEALRRAEAGDFVRAAMDPWPWQWDAPLAFAGKFFLEQGQILLNLVRGGRITATEAGQQAREAGVTRYELSQRRGPVTWIRDIRATQKYYHIRTRSEAPLGILLWQSTDDIAIGTSLMVFGTVNVVGAFYTASLPGGAILTPFWLTHAGASYVSGGLILVNTFRHLRHAIELTP